MVRVAKESVKVSLLQGIRGHEMVFDKKQYYGNPITSGMVHRPPNIDLAFLNELCIYAQRFRSGHGKLIGAGDFNLVNYESHGQQR